MIKMKDGKKLKLFFIFWKVFHVKNFLGFTLWAFFGGFHYKFCLGVSTNVGKLFTSTIPSCQLWLSNSKEPN
jgi:hypothetical protein